MSYPTNVWDAIHQAQDAIDIEEFYDENGNLDDDAYIQALNEAEESARERFYPHFLWND